MSAGVIGSPESVALLAMETIDQLRGSVRAAGLDDLDRLLEKAYDKAEKDSRDE